MLKITRTSLFAALAVAALAGGVVTADDKMDMKSDMSQCVMKQADSMKEMAANPSQMKMMKEEMVKMMVMDHMAMKIASDPQCKQALMAAMDDENVKKTHMAAMQEMKDPAMMKKVMDEVMADPMAMKAVIHSAMMVAHEKPMDKMGEKMMEHAPMK